ncbi:MAG: sigma-70 family RNA polymerase sigma factor [Planctomycetaceae bacterium]
MSEEFVQLFTRNQRRLYLLILSQVGNIQDAEEILQDTNCVVLTKHPQFEAGTNFFAWTAQIATFEILKFRQRHGRSKLRFTDQFLDLVAVEAEAAGENLDGRREALERCLQKLRAKDRKLIQSRYEPSTSAKEMAESIGRPANSVYQSLGRIRRTLLECISRQLADSAELRPQPTR